MKLAHIINPVLAPPSSELGIAQPITFESIRVAKAFSAGKVEVELYTVSFEEDRAMIPDYFTLLPDLKRSVLDLATFSTKKKYPILKDVFSAAHQASDAGFLIYSNMDIALMPQFYQVVADALYQGHDALLITRRGISGGFKRIEELPAMYSEYGRPHPGYDCFIFKRELLNKIILENICLGVSFSEVAVVHNLIAFAEKPKFIDDMHLTFHIGSEVMPPLSAEYLNHNKREYQEKIYPRLKPYLEIRKFPYSQLPWHKRIIKWMLNPVFRTHQVTEMEGKGIFRRLKFNFDTVRFSLLEKIR